MNPPGPPVRVLLVDDDRGEFRLLRGLLADVDGADFRLDWVDSFDEGLADIRAAGHDAYLIDYRLGERTGVELIREAVRGGCQAPMILLTGQGDRAVDLDAMRAGAADYLSKDHLSGPLLERAVRYAIERLRAQESLRQAQKMEAVGRLAGGIAHDFNNMMTVVTGYSELMLHQLAPGDPNHELAREVKRAGERCAELTRQLLAFSRKQMFTLRVVRPGEVVANLDGMLRPLLGEDVSFFTDVAGSAGSVRADPSQLEQVVLNLAINARDAMPRGGTLTVRVHDAEVQPARPPAPDAPPGRYVALTVSDTGEGMDAATQARVFEPFFTTKGKGKGTGLGLATVYGVVKQSGGFVTVHSEPGRGSTFKVYLPRVDEPAAAAEAAPAPAPGGKETVLVVEDEDGVRRLLRHVLAAAGYRVLEAGNGAEALEVCRRHDGPIDLVVTDVVMPQMGGGDLAARLASLRPGVKILFLSGYTEDAVVRHGVEGASVAFLAKPFTAPELARKVREVLDEGAGRG